MKTFKGLWVIPIVASITASAYGRFEFDDLFRRLSRPSKELVLTSTREEKPYFKLTPKLLSFQGVIKIPGYMKLERGSAKLHGSAGQFIIDGQIICDYSPRGWTDIYYVLRSCSDGSRAGDKIDVQNKLEVRLNHASSEKASLTARVSVISSESAEYGIVFPYLKADEGDILRFNGEAWVAASVSELGLDGIKGDKGDPGEMGPQGPQGPAGAMGPAGAAGAAGAQGPKGDKGDPGVAGTQGPAGAMGPAGAAGAAGAQGPQGLKGDKGDPGVAGAQGPAGAAGAIGPMGPQGPQGPKGDKGDKGDTGVAGAQGPIGPEGPQGPQGPQGPAGPAGSAGSAGSDGAVGAQGPQGLKGDKGDPGVAGAQGPQGPIGPAGADGAVGPQGLPGPQGLTGAQGPQGPKGDKGEKGDRGLSEIAYLRDERSSGQHGGSCVGGGTWNTRALNVLGGDISFVSLSANRFVLQPGTYFVEISAPAYAVGAHQAKLKVIETGLDALNGSTSFSHATSGTVSHSIISGELIVAAASTFEVQHRCSTEKLNFGLGLGANFGTPEIYTQVKIIKKQ